MNVGEKFNYQKLPGHLVYLFIMHQGRTIISTGCITAPQEPYPDEKNTNWEENKNIISTAPEINYNDLEGKTAADLHQEFNRLYERIEEAKERATPLKTTQKINNLKPTAKFKRLTKILSRYHEQLLNHGKTQHLERVIRDTELMLIQEGNQCKYEWWEAQLQRVELAAKCNKKFWRRVTCLSGKKKKGIPTLKYNEDGTEKCAKTDEEKVKVFTKLMKDTCNITEEENRHYCQETETRVETTLRENADKVTPKWTINIARIRDPHTSSPDRQPRYCKLDEITSKQNTREIEIQKTSLN